MSGENRPKVRPSWALAWISNDWRKTRPVASAYKLASADDDDLTATPSDEVFTAVIEGRGSRLTSAHSTPYSLSGMRSHD